MFDYFEEFQVAHQRGYMKYVVSDDEYQTLLKELDAHFINHEVDVIRERDGKTVIIGLVGVEYAAPKPAYTVTIAQKHGRYKFNAGDVFDFIQEVNGGREVEVFSHKHKKVFTLHRTGFWWMVGKQ